MNSPEGPKLFQKSQSPWRWAILPFGCMMMLGSYYCFELPAGLKVQLRDYLHTPDSEFELKFSLLYTLYAAPNIVLPIIGGFIVDRIGVGKSQLLFCILLCIGQALFSLGLSIQSWPLLLTGRFIFGLGGENFDLANTTMLSEWFCGRELAFSFGLNMSIGMLGYVLCILISPQLARGVGILAAVWLGTILCILCTLLVLVTMRIESKVSQENSSQRDVWIALSSFTDNTDDDISNEADNIPAIDDEISFIGADKLYHYRQKSTSTSPQGKYHRVDSKEASILPKEKKRHPLLNIQFLLLIGLCGTGYAATLPFNNISYSVILERDYFKPQSPSCTLRDPTQCQSANNPPLHCSLSHNYQPPLPANYSSAPELIDCNQLEYKEGCTAEYCSALLEGESKASLVMSLPSMISIVLFPMLGLGVDYFGYRVILCGFAGICLLLVHLSLGYGSMEPIVPMLGQGVAYTIFVSVVWPCVPLVVPSDHVGVAYGLMYAMENFSDAFFPFIIAEIYTHSGNRYIPNVETFFAVLGVILLVLSIALHIIDYRTKRVLNKGLIAITSKDTYSSVSNGEDAETIHNELHF